MTIHLEASQVPAQLRGGYQGRKFKAVVCEEMTVPADAGLWSGGSREKYSAIEFATGKRGYAAFQDEAPWGERRAVTVKLVPGLAIVRESIFCGQDMGLTFYVHPENAAKLLPAPVELGDVDRLVLRATASYKSSYGGRDRYEMARDDYGGVRGEADKPSFPSRPEWDAAKAGLASRGLLTKAGAITPAGRALGERY